MLCRKKVTKAYDWIMKEQMVKERGVGKPIHGLLELPRLKMFEPCNGKPSNFVEEDDKGMTQREERM